MNDQNSTLLNLKVKMKVKSRPTLCDPKDCNLSGSSVHGIFQATVLEWIVISYFCNIPGYLVE